VYSFASYYRDAWNEEIFKLESDFLGWLNNETTGNESSFGKRQKDGTISLRKLTLIQFTNDIKREMNPYQSAHFGYYKNTLPKSDDPFVPGVVYSFTESPFYEADKLGLKTLNDAGKVSLKSMGVAHMAIAGENEAKYILYNLYP